MTPWRSPKTVLTATILKPGLQSLVAWHDQASEILLMLAILSEPSSDD
jgi:hypothetical protein